MQLPNHLDRASYSKRLEDAVAEAGEGATARQVARRMRLAESTVRAIDPRYKGRERKRETSTNSSAVSYAAGNANALKQPASIPGSRSGGPSSTGRCQTVYNKFHIMQHANAAIDEVRKAEFFRSPSEGTTRQPL